MKVTPQFKADILHDAEIKGVNQLLMNAIVEDVGQCLQELLLSVSQCVRDWF